MAAKPYHISKMPFYGFQSTPRWDTHREKKSPIKPVNSLKTTIHFLFPISYFPFSSLLMFLAVGGRSGAGVGEKGFGEAERGGVTHGPGHLVEC